jgi:hypothetical protein
MSSILSIIRLLLWGSLSFNQRPIVSEVHGVARLSEEEQRGRRFEEPGGVTHPAVPGHGGEIDAHGDRIAGGWAERPREADAMVVDVGPRNQLKAMAGELLLRGADRSRSGTNCSCPPACCCRRSTATR